MVAGVEDSRRDGDDRYEDHRGQKTIEPVQRGVACCDQQVRGGSHQFDATSRASTAASRTAAPPWSLLKYA